MTEQLFIRQFSQMPEDMKREVVRYFEYLVFKYNLEHGKKSPPNDSGTVQRHPKAGFLKGTFILSDDFDAPLDDFNAYI
jgi:hypothetical protein